MSRKIRGKPGVTLIELIISLAIASILIYTAVSLNLFGIRTFNTGQAKAGNQSEVRMASDFIARKARYAKTVRILDYLPVPSDGCIDIYLDSGRMVYRQNTRIPSPPGTGDGADYTLLLKRENDSMIYYKIGKAGSSEYDAESYLNIDNIQKGFPVKDTTSGGFGVCLRLSFGDSPIEDMECLSIPDRIYGDIYLPVIGPNGTTITWNSSNPSVLTNTGKVLGPAAPDPDANVTLTAALAKGSLRYTRTFNVTVASSAGISSVDDKTILILEGSQYSLPGTVDAKMSNGSTISANVSWHPDTIDTSKTGTFNFSGKVEGYADTINLAVIIKPKVVSISVKSEGNKTQILKGQTLRMSADVLPKDAFNKEVLWSTSDSTIAAITQDGTLMGVKTGKVIVTAIALDGSGKSGDMQITVKQPDSVNLIIVNSSKDAILKGEELKMSAVVKPDSASNIDVKWTTDNSGIAAIDSNGKLTAVGYGIVKVTAAAMDGSSVTGFKMITVKPPAPKVRVTGGTAHITNILPGAKIEVYRRTEFFGFEDKMVNTVVDSNKFNLSGIDTLRYDYYVVQIVNSAASDKEEF